MPSRVRKPCTCPAGALRGSPASTTSTARRDRASINAPLSPAAPPPTTTTSYCWPTAARSCPISWSTTCATSRLTSFACRYGKDGRRPTLEDVLEAVGPRLRALRSERGLTLAELSETTGHLGEHAVAAGVRQRKPTLELLLPLARAYRVAAGRTRRRTGDRRPPGAPARTHGA